MCTKKGVTLITVGFGERCETFDFDHDSIKSILVKEGTWNDKRVLLFQEDDTMHNLTSFS
jgi:hypothetical protein